MQPINRSNAVYAVKYPQTFDLPIFYTESKRTVKVQKEE